MISKKTSIFVGTAGWNVPGELAPEFVGGSSALERYASRFAAVEINSSFHRAHRPSTWAKWGESVPSAFRFSVKVPRSITHERKLVGCADLLASFLDEIAPLGAKLAVLLVQLPPSLEFDAPAASGFVEVLQALTPVPSVLEPRHPSWFDSAADQFLARHRIARVAADPPRVPAAAAPGGWLGRRYWRLHGSPTMYRSPYGRERLEGYADQIRRYTGGDSWCMFDNTAASAAAGDALLLSELLSGPGRVRA